jgi:hypothetical protein
VVIAELGSLDWKLIRKCAEHPGRAKAEVLESAYDESTTRKTSTYHPQAGAESRRKAAIGSR